MSRTQNKTYSKFLSPDFVFYCLICLAAYAAASFGEAMRPAIWLSSVITYRAVVQYLLVIHENRDVSKGKKGRFWHIVLYLGIGLVTVLPPIESLFFCRKVNIYIVFCGVIFMIIAAWVRYLAMSTLEKNYSAFVEVRHHQILVNKGIYALIRHPAYLALILFAAGSSLIMQAYLSLAFAFLVFLPIIYGRTVTEEKELSLNLENYRKYMEDTKRFIPFVY